MNKHTVSPSNAKKFKEWLDTRGGILIWQSINLSNPGASWSTPALNEDGSPYTKPSWQSSNTPARHITDAEDIVVETTRVVDSLHVAVERGCGFSFNLTTASSKRLRDRVSKAEKRYAKEAWYEFDYFSYKNALIVVSDKQIPLLQFLTEEKVNDSELKNG